MLPGVERFSVGNVDANAIADVVDEGGDPTMRQLDPESVARLAGTVTIAGKEYQPVVLAELQVADGVMRVVPRDVRGSDGDPLPEPVTQLVRQAFALRIDPGGLPFGVVPTKLQARDGTLEISGEAHDVVVGSLPGSGVAG
jgi:hypothetical protein